MKLKNVKVPFYIQLASILLTLTLIITIVYAGSHIIMPFLLSVLFAILLRPLVVFLNEKIKLPHVLAVFLSVTLFLAFIGAIIFFISRQISDFQYDWPQIKQNLRIHSEHIHQWIQQKFKISYTKQNSYWERLIETPLNNNQTLVGNTITSFSQTFLNIVLIPIYTFLVLLYRNLFKKFLTNIISLENHMTMINIIREIKIVMQSYIVGLMIEMGIVSILTTTGLMIIKVPYAILLGIITAVLNLIPYIGVWCAGIISIIAALIYSTKLSVIFGVIAVNAIVQLIDNNFLIPKIVASKVKINALVSIIGVIIGGAISGVSGMFLAIPVIAILKVIFDRIDELRPWGLLMGDDFPEKFEWNKSKLFSLNVDEKNTKQEGENKNE